MARIELVPEVLEDLDRFVEHLSRHGVEPIASRVAEIIAAVDVLTTSPMIGRPTRDGLRELLIGHGARGYVALYRFVPDLDTVFVLAMRHQSHPGYGSRDP
jgi:plasmid stabilization system protein ParE